MGVGVWLQAANGDVGGVSKGATADDDVYTDGETFSANFGMDARFGSWLAGMGYGTHSTTADYGFASRREDPASEYELELGALQPYFAYDAGADAAGGGAGLRQRRAGAQAGG